MISLLSANVAHCATVAWFHKMFSAELQAILEPILHISTQAVFGRNLQWTTNPVLDTSTQGPNLKHSYQHRVFNCLCYKIKLKAPTSPNIPLGNWTVLTQTTARSYDSDVLTVCSTAQSMTHRPQFGRSCHTWRTRSCRPVNPRCLSGSSRHCPGSRLRGEWWPTPGETCHLRWKQETLTTLISHDSLRQ